MKRMIYVIFALLAASLILTSQVRGVAPANCKTPVLFGDFLWGLDYQQEALVYALRCPAEEMTVIFKISDIIWLDVHTVTEDDLEAGDPRRVRIGITEFAAELKYRPTGNLILATWLEEYSKPYKPLSRPIQETIRAYREGTTSITAIRARVKFVSAERVEGTQFAFAWVVLQPNKIERRSG